MSIKRAEKIKDASKKGNLSICHNIDGPGRHMLTEITQTERQILCNLFKHEI